jgi:hypothetical protein
MPIPIQHDINQAIRRHIMTIDGFARDLVGFDCGLIVVEPDEPPDCPWSQSCGKTVHECPLRERFYRLAHAPQRYQ